VKYKTLVRVLLKLLGVYFVVQGFCTFLTSAVSMVWVLSIRPLSAGFHYYLVAPIASLAQIGLGAYLFLGGEWIVNKVIPSNRPYCHECGYDLTGAVENRCPECGTPFAAAGRTRGAEAE